MAEIMNKTLKNPQIEKEVLDLNLPDKCLSPFIEKESLIFLASASYLREDHINDFVQRAPEL
jgi:hypothetical protein